MNNIMMMLHGSTKGLFVNLVLFLVIAFAMLALSALAGCRSDGDFDTFRAATLGGRAAATAAAEIATTESHHNQLEIRAESARAQSAFSTMDALYLEPPPIVPDEIAGNENEDQDQDDGEGDGDGEYELDEEAEPDG